jgi:hypothetical protein
MINPGLKIVCNDLVSKATRGNHHHILVPPKVFEQIKKIVKKSNKEFEFYPEPFDPKPWIDF